MFVAVAAGVGLWQRQQAPQVPEGLQRLAPDAGCDLRLGPCALPLPSGGKVILEINPPGIQPMTELRLDVRIEGDAEGSAYAVDFAGVDMDMGFNRVRLVPEGEGHYTGTGMIPVCVRDRMGWEAVVLLSRNGNWVGAPFRFEVVRQ